MSGRKRVLLFLAVVLALGSLASGSAALAAVPCSNEEVRTGASATLPDCRAYELVTPPDTNGRLLESIVYFTLGRAFDLFPTELASPVRDNFIYETFAGGLAAPPGGSGIFDMYEVERGEEGWRTTRHLSRSASSLVPPLPGGVSSDHTYSFQAEGHSSNANATYLRKPDGSYEPIGVGSLGTEPRAQGRYISEGGAHIVFSTGSVEVGTEVQDAWCKIGCVVRQLEPNAAPTGTGAIYDRSPTGPTRVVSLLPGDVPAVAGEDAFFKGISKDASAIAFRIGDVLYVRLDGLETEEVAAGNPTFGGLSDDGRYLFYVIGGTIHRFNTETKADVDINSIGEGKIVNVSADGSHVYFVSDQQLDGSKGSAGQPNLYVWAGAAPEYIATVAASDLVQTSGHLAGIPALTNWSNGVLQPLPEREAGPGADSSRTTPDGEVLVFESKAQLTAYDSAGHTEIYRYDDVAKSLDCVSCNPDVSTASADARLQEVDAVGPPIIIHNLSNDGRYVFFETSEALVEGDTNGVNDIYEWVEQGGIKTVQLISSGKSPEYALPEGWESNYFPLPNLLLAITPNGSDVFFAAEDVLVPGAGEGGTQAIYDARVNGGFPESAAPQMCFEEDCHPTTSSRGSSTDQALASEVTVGVGNVKPRRSACHSRKRRKSRRHQCRHHHKHKARASAVQSPGTAANDPAASSSPSGDGVLSSSSPGPLAGQAGVVTTSAGEDEEFKIDNFKAELSAPGSGTPPEVQTAGAMPSDFTTALGFSHFFDEGKPGHETASASAETISFSLPPGLIGNPTATPTCDTGNFVAHGNCSTDTQVGITTARVGFPLYSTVIEPIYNLTPPHPNKELARFGFIAYFFPVFIDVKVRTASDYGVTATVHDSPGLGALVRAKATLWGDPASDEHNYQRLTQAELAECENLAACKVKKAGGTPSTIPIAARKAFISSPSACQGGTVGLEVATYQQPGEVFGASAPLAPITNCVGLPFAPELTVEPSSHVAGAPTGLRTKLTIPQHLGATERASATMREARVSLPIGMQIAAGAANWIGTCSEDEVGYHEEVDARCPDSAKLGTATILSPALSVPIEGTIYQRSPRPGHQLGLWLASDALGMHIKLPGELEPDKTTGHLTAVFRDLPQVPVEEIDLDVWGGPRAPLQNPDHCGTFTTDFSFSPHSDDPAAIGQSTMAITEGCNQPFNPTLKAGVTEPVAGKYSPFVFDLTRPDGDQALRGFSLHLPDGELAKIKGVPLCPDADAAAATCPAGSRIGSVQATTGPGPEPFTIPAPGKAQPQIYLAGPYQGASFSIVTEVPAQAGPFDLGVLAVRSGLDVEPETGRAVVKADPLPQFFEGVGIAYRNLHAVVDRPEFNLNPTDCREMAVTTDVSSTQGAVAHPQTRFQVDGCHTLKFKPKLSLNLRGGTKRAQYPALTAVLKARNGDANIGFASVALPHSEFLAQEHIGTICTRKQFAADTCPKGSVYGKAKAVTPLLDKPLSGPVYLRSSDHPLPDLVVKLDGQLEIDLVGRIDSVHGGIRATFESVPDAPVSKFVLQMKGGAKSLLTNSTDICRGAHRATVRMRAQNGRVANLRPKLVSGGCGGKKLGKHKKHH